MVTHFILLWKKYSLASSDYAFILWGLFFCWVLCCFSSWSLPSDDRWYFPGYYFCFTEVNCQWPKLKYYLYCYCTIPHYYRKKWNRKAVLLQFVVSDLVSLKRGPLWKYCLVFLSSMAYFYGYDWAFPTSSCIGILFDLSCSFYGVCFASVSYLNHKANLLHSMPPIFKYALSVWWKVYLFLFDISKCQYSITYGWE